MIKCPKCAELIQPDAKLCKHCGANFGNSGCANLAAIVAVIALLYFFFGDANDAPPGSSQSSSNAPVPLSAEVRKQCASLIDLGKKEGVIRERPAANRINVDELRWAALPASTKTDVLKGLACDAFGVQMDDLGAMEFVVAYGFRSGKRLAMFGAEGTSFE